MKKLLVLLVSAALVLSMAAVSMAAVTISGDVSTKYDFETALDSYEAKATLESKVNDQLSAKLVLKGASGADVAVDEWNFIYKPGFADIQVGFWGYKVKGLVDVISFNFDDFKVDGAGAILFSKNLDNGFNLGLWYTVDGSTVKQDVADNAVVLNVGYTNDYVDVDLYAVETQLAGKEFGYSLTAALTMWESITPYLAYAEDEDEITSCILGAKYAVDALEVRAEIDLEDEVADDAYGIKVKYTFSSGIYTEYVNTFADGDTAKNEIKFGVKFK